jgi:uncharacterized protein YjdB
MKNGSGLIAALAVLSLGGCRLLPTACTLELRTEVSPAERTIRVGESFTAQAFTVTCGGRDRERADVTWNTTDAAVVDVEAATGRITGKAPGTATVAAQEPSSALPYGSVTMHVTS